MSFDFTKQGIRRCNSVSVSTSYVQDMKLLCGLQRKDGDMPCCARLMCIRKELLPLTLLKQGLIHILLDLMQYRPASLLLLRATQAGALCKCLLL